MQKWIELLILLGPVLILSIVMALPSKRDSLYQAETISNILDEGMDTSGSSITSRVRVAPTEPESEIPSATEGTLASQTASLANVLEANNFSNIESTIASGRASVNSIDDILN